MTEQHRILVAGPKKSDNERIVFHLTQALFDARAAVTIDDAADECARFAPEILILDADFPEQEPAAVCLSLRSRTAAPILLLSEKHETGNRILALEAGADVFMAKPCDARELIAQVSAMLRRSFPQADKTAGLHTPALFRTGKYVEYPGLLINLTNYSVLYMGKSVETPPKELELFYFLAASPNQVFSREQLLDRLWGFDYMGDTRTVDVHIKRLREKFPATEDWAIRTVWGVGYKFEVDSRKSQTT